MNGGDALLQGQGVTKRFGGFVALKNVSFEIKRGERLALIGPNGSGKTTLVSCISGSLRPKSGRLVFDRVDVTRKSVNQRVHLGIARSFQISRPFLSMTVLENLLVPLTFAVRRPAAVGAGAEDHARAILDRFGLAKIADAPSATLTQIDRRKLELARAFAANPTLLIADETLAGLSSSEVDEVVDLLLQLNAENITIVMIEHIMHAVMRFSQRVLCLDAGEMIADATPDEVTKIPAVRRAYLGA